MTEKVVMFINGIETQGYFSMQIGKALKKAGKSIFYYDYWEEEKSFEELQKFIEPEKTIMITFNFHGLEEGEVFYNKNGTIFWDIYHIPCFNIVVDHPLYYHKFLQKLPEQYYQISIDRYHEKYMKKYWENVALGPFLPLAGTKIAGTDRIPIEKRPIDVIITGNYTPPETFQKYIERIDEEYTRFYMEIINDLLENEDKTIEQAAEEHLQNEIPGITHEEIRETIGNLTFIDLYVRFFLRGEVIRQLADSGIAVHTCGKGWELLKCEHHENIIEHGGMDSAQCLEMIAKSKISINVMPWFKDGAHDRIYNSLLNGAICISDGSIYLREHFTDRMDICFYKQTETEKIPELVKTLLADEKRMQNMADAGYQNAVNGHTWENYAQRLLAFASSL